MHTWCDWFLYLQISSTSLPTRRTSSTVRIHQVAEYLHPPPPYRRIFRNLPTQKICSPSPEYLQSTPEQLQSPPQNMCRHPPQNICSPLPPIRICAIMEYKCQVLIFEIFKYCSAKIGKNCFKILICPKSSCPSFFQFVQI